MNGFYTHLVGDAGTHRHCVSNLDILALEFAFGASNTGLFPTSGRSGTVFLPADVYGTTCEMPPPWWRDRAPEPVVDFQPNPEPEPEPEPEAEPEPASEIVSPFDGQRMKRKALKAIRGEAGTGTDAPVDHVYVAVTKRGARGRCSWWKAKTKTFKEGPCSSPVWNLARGAERWSLAIKASLPSGRYDAMSKAVSGEHIELCCTSGVNGIRFRLN
jgi:hypothetical protein